MQLSVFTVTDDAGKLGGGKTLANFSDHTNLII
jgi:hypothetical protein